MTWTDFFLICFAVGVTFSVISLLVGSLHLHWPYFHVHAGVRVGRGGAGPVNIGTVAAFLAWFGGAGYLISRYSSAWIVIAVGGAVASGLMGATIVFLFLARVLMRHDEVLDPADYEMVGVLGTVSSSIRESGTGEVTFSQAGSRRAAAARSDSGAAIPKGAEVVVTRYEAGIAYVRLWEELAKSTAKQ
jgi:hypothetical protein